MCRKFPPAGSSSAGPTPGRLPVLKSFDLATGRAVDEDEEDDDRED